MSTNDFIFILLWSLFGLLVVEGICVPIIIAVVNKTRPQRELRSRERLADQFTQDAALMFSDIYAEIKSGSISAPQELEDRVLDMCARASDLKAGSRRREIV